MRIADTVLRQRRRARRAAIGRLTGHRAHLRLVATTARLVAVRPGGPIAHEALFGAACRVARLRLLQGRARRTAIERIHRHRARARLGAATAARGALAPRRPIRHLASNRSLASYIKTAFLYCADQRIPEYAIVAAHRARHARLGGPLAILAVPHLRDIASWDGTRAMLSRTADLTRDGARGRVACAGLRQGRRASGAAILRLLRNGARLRLRAAAARFVACRPIGPTAHLARFRATLGIANRGFHQGRAPGAAILRSDNLSARAAHSAATATRGAFAPAAPSRYLAVDRRPTRHCKCAIRQGQKKKRSQ